MDAEASQENFKRPEKAPKRHPKRHPKVVQNLVKKWLKSEAKTAQNEPKTTMAYGKKIALTGGCFDVFGLSKNAYFEDVFKMPTNCSRCLKKVPK